MEKEKESFLKRWSKRKTSIGKDKLDVADFEKKHHPIEKKPESDKTDSLEGLSDEEILEKLKLPDPAGMKKGDDFTAFLTKKVPEHIKKKALRKLWLSNPIFGHLDGMNEYDEDFTLATSALETFATNYVVGKGFRGQFSLDENEVLDGGNTEELKASSVRLTDPNDANKETETADSKLDPNEDEEGSEIAEVEETREKDINSEQVKVKEKQGSEDNSITQDVDHDRATVFTNSRIKPKKMVFKG